VSAERPPRHICYVGLGSNIHPEENLRIAAQELRTLFPDIMFSFVHKSRAMYEEEQEDFLNAVVRFETEEPLEGVYGKLREIEKKLKKAPAKRCGPRTIDLDLLLYGNHVILSPTKDETALHVPHPRMHERRFVLEPLCELIDTNASHPVTKEQWGDLLKKSRSQDCIKISITL
jgi:2-amino-4-hydroxy-6-hydroxymethyldihydropteridine diphosphokinase